MRTNILTISSAIVALSTLAAAAPHRRDNTSAPGLSLTAQLQLADRYVNGNKFTWIGDLTGAIA